VRSAHDLWRDAERGELVLVGHAQDELRRDDPRERVRDRAAAVGRDREVDAERPSVGDDARQRVDQLAEVHALERGGEPRVAVEQHHDARHRLARLRRVVGESERAGTRELRLAPLERAAEEREQPLDALLVLGADHGSGVR
jgi:hypothetical protein